MIKKGYNNASISEERRGFKMTFDELQLHEDILKAIAQLQYKTVMPVQEKVIPAMMKHEDVLVRSRTGSGKTAAFAIPIIQDMEWNQREPQALVLTPTRELALQIKEDFDNLSAYRRLKTLAIFGKQPYRFQIQDLKQRVHVVVGTPGRILDHLERGTLHPEKIRYVVLDEADEMLNMGFIDQVKDIFHYLPTKRTTCLFSATLPDEIKTLAQGFMNDVKEISITQEASVNHQITHYAYQLKEKDKLSFLIKLLAKEQPSSCIIFARTQEGVKTICDALYDLDLCVDKLHGGMLQEDRIENIHDFKLGKVRILVATDVASRGIDVENISHIINYDMPNQKETYMHRIGRTGRKQASGVAITLLNEYDELRLQELEEYLGYPLDLHDRCVVDDVMVNEEVLAPLCKPFEIREEKGKTIHEKTLKIYMNGGKTKKIRPGDIVGAICEIDGVCAEDIGIIQVQETQSYVDILNGKGMLVLKALQKKTIKGKKLKIQKAK